MVQLYKYQYGPMSLNEYCRLDSGTALLVRPLREHLSDEHFTTIKQTAKPRLIELYIRCQRGLLSYEGLSLRELKTFAAQRAVTVGTNATLKVLKGLLEEADDDATFTRFSELPPELRQIVYQHYFNSLVIRESSYKHQPPVTLVSRSLRKESLPLSYECCNFTIGADAGLTIIPCKLVPDIRTAPFIQNTAIEHFARIKSHKLDFHNLRAHIHLDLRNKDNPVVSVTVYIYYWTLRPNTAGRAGYKQLLSELRALYMGIAAREGPMKLRMSDIEEMCEMARQIPDLSIPSDGIWRP